MKHNFLLNESVLYHAIKGVDKHDNPDLTAAELLGLIARNCHTITLHPVIVGKYWRHLNAMLATVRSPILHPITFISQFIKNSAKAVWEYSQLPELPPGVVIPHEDVPIVQAALLSHPLVVTSDEGLRNAINQHEDLGLRALSATEALELAKET